MNKSTSKTITTQRNNSMETLDMGTIATHPAPSVAECTARQMQLALAWAWAAGVPLPEQLGTYLDRRFTVKAIAAVVMEPWRPALLPLPCVRRRGMSINSSRSNQHMVNTHHSTINNRMISSNSRRNTLNTEPGISIRILITSMDQRKVKVMVRIVVSHKRFLGSRGNLPRANEKEIRPPFRIIPRRSLF